MIKSRTLRWAGHVARMEEGRSAFKRKKVRELSKIVTGTPIGESTIRKAQA